MFYKKALLALISLGSLLCTACGQKGPLYEPQSAPSNAPTENQQAHNNNVDHTANQAVERR